MAEQSIKERIIRYALQYIKEKSIDNFILFDVVELPRPNKYELRFEFWGKFPDKEIAHIVGIRDNPDRLKYLAEQGIDTLQEWFEDALNSPKLQEKVQKWIDDGKPLTWPISEEVLKIQEELSI